MSDMTLKELVDTSFDNSRAHGFYDGIEDKKRDSYIIATKLMLIVSELAEALEDARAGNWGIKLYDDETGDFHPTGFDNEIADAFIRLGDLVGWQQIDIEYAIQEKQAYNTTRPYKHGKTV